MSHTKEMRSLILGIVIISRVYLGSSSGTFSGPYIDDNYISWILKSSGQNLFFMKTLQNGGNDQWKVTPNHRMGFYSLSSPLPRKNALYRNVCSDINSSIGQTFLCRVHKSNKRLQLLTKSMMFLRGSIKQHFKVKPTKTDAASRLHYHRQKGPLSPQTNHIPNINKFRDDIAYTDISKRPSHMYVSPIQRTFRLTSGTHYNLFIGPEGLVTGYKWDAHPGVLLLFETLESDLVRIKNFETGRYLAMDSQGWLISLEHPDKCLTVFAREYTPQNYSQFWWVDICRRHVTGGKRWYIGLNKRGFPLPGARTSEYRPSTHFQIRYM